MLYYHVNSRVFIVWHWEIILSNVLNFDSIGVIFYGLIHLNKYYYIYILFKYDYDYSYIINYISFIFNLY